ncbi:30S ribosomal protein S20 [Polyangium mundeleinium]|uniref:Small ribosomal subunit protein bS20 n=1 Tax=Polyangium mundeleinium TaxID=2995306 RepID=A0ABT5F6E1_9BACT|nr:30S ribosomal protein S20 [Polyangium mundeleinium]MDC0749521.1 30S ribosomal protein S20 [Polyangium mundeleinium]
MANHASADKRNRQRIKRTARNRAAKSALRTELKKARASITATPADAAKTVREAIGALDGAAHKGTIPRKRASRLQGRLARALHKASKAA